MSRPLRIQGAGLVYHAMARGNNKMPIFLDDLDYARFVEILDEVRHEYELDAWVYCAMPNHSHLVFRTRLPNLSAAMRQLNGCYAGWWNRRHHHVGHVYQARFKAHIVEAATYLLRLVRYVLMNPVRAGLVRHPGDWAWSSYADLAGTRSTCVDVDSLVHAIDPDHHAEVRERLLEFVDGYADDEIAAFLRSDRRVIGSDSFAARFRHEARRASREIPERERRIGTLPLATIVADAVCRGEGLPGGIRAAHDALFSVSEIAACTGLSPVTVRRIVAVPSAPVALR
jgi:putative transposase